MATSLTKAELTEAFDYLDELRESGRTNMWGAAAYLERELVWPQAEASEAVRLWMQTFATTPVADRVEKAVAA